MVKIIYLIAGGALGTVARYGLTGIVHRCFPGVFPLGTLLVNLGGSFMIGFLWGLWEGKNVGSNLRSFVFIGVLGSFTTFSTYSLESLHLIRAGEIKLALLNVLTHNILGLLLVFLGYLSSHSLKSLAR